MSKLTVEELIQTDAVQKWAKAAFENRYVKPCGEDFVASVEDYRGALGFGHTEDAAVEDLRSVLPEWAALKVLDGDDDIAELTHEVLKENTEKALSALSVEEHGELIAMSEHAEKEMARYLENRENMVHVREVRVTWSDEDSEWVATAYGQQFDYENDCWLPVKKQSISVLDGLPDRAARQLFALLRENSDVYQWSVSAKGLCDQVFGVTDWVFSVQDCEDDLDKYEAVCDHMPDAASMGDTPGECLIDMLRWAANYIELQMSEGQRLKDEGNRQIYPRPEGAASVETLISWSKP